MKPLQKHLWMSTFLCLFFLACLPDDGESSDYDQELETLTILKAQIESLAANSACNDSSDCRYIAFGSKPCGGPWSYLVYSTSIDTTDLENMVGQYNQLEALFNAKWGIASDCAVVTEPVDVICENNICVAVY